MHMCVLNIDTEISILSEHLNFLPMHSMILQCV